MDPASIGRRSLSRSASAGLSRFGWLGLCRWLRRGRLRRRSGSRGRPWRRLRSSSEQPPQSRAEEPECSAGEAGPRQWRLGGRPGALFSDGYRRHHGQPFGARGRAADRASPPLRPPGPRRARPRAQRGRGSAGEASAAVCGLEELFGTGTGGTGAHPVGRPMARRCGDAAKAA